MKCRTSSSDLAILKKDLTRFAPAWLSLCAILGLYYSSIRMDNYLTDEFISLATVYAALLGILVFGYLCDPVECNMVHSLPIRRSRLFWLHCLSASIMYLVPYAVFTFATRDMYSQTMGYCFLYYALDFFLQFPIILLCMMVTGRKLGAALLYFFIQTFSAICMIVIEILYLPNLPGLNWNSIWLPDSPATIVYYYAELSRQNGLMDRDWLFLGQVLGASALMFAAALLMYRRRKVEHAGDLLAVTWLDPVFAVCSAFAGICVVYVSTYEVELPICLVGAGFGYLFYWMLSKKTARVFTLKILLGLACVLAGIWGSVELVRMDPLGLIHYVPDQVQVEEVTIYDSYRGGESYTATAPMDIYSICQIHEELIDHHISIGEAEYAADRDAEIVLVYTLADGRYIEREYNCADPELIERLEWYLSQPSAQFGAESPELRITQVKYNWEVLYFDRQRSEELIELLMRESRAGNLYDLQGDESDWRIYLESSAVDIEIYVDVPNDAVELIAWLNENCEQ